MSIYSDKLREMINAADEQVENIGKSTDQIQEQIDELQDEDDAIVIAMLDPVASDLQDYLTNTKLKMVYLFGQIIIDLLFLVLV